MGKLNYYLSSIPVLLGGVRNPQAVMALLAGKTPQTIRFSSGLRLGVRSLMELWIAKETCLDRQYEAFGIPIQNDWVVLDVGAGIGDFAVMVAREHPAAQVYAFEPFVDSFVLLESNAKLNDLSNIIACPVAIGAKTGELALATTGASVQHTTTGSTRQGSAVRELRVQSISLDDLFTGAGAIAKCDFMKMDCEGAEYDIFFNASAATLAKIDRICMEYHDELTPHNHAELAQFFQSHGYMVKTERNPVHGYIGLMYAERKV